MHPLQPTSCAPAAMPNVIKFCKNGHSPDGDFFFKHTKRDRGQGGAEPDALGQSKRNTATAAPRQALEIFETNTYRQLN